MCNFFSYNTYEGKYYYFDWKLRQEILVGKLNYNPDSHTSIADHFGFKGIKEDKMNKYEYNPLTKEFKVDQINSGDDSKKAEEWVKALDFKTVVEPLIIKPIIHPFKLKPVKKVSNSQIILLKDWDSVWDSVGDSVWDSVGDSVRDSVWDSVWASVGDSVWDSVRDSVRDSVWDSVWAYYSTFFDLKYKVDVSPAAKLWEQGLVPSFDGKLWRLHTGKDAKIIYEISKEKLSKSTKGGG